MEKQEQFTLRGESSMEGFKKKPEFPVRDKNPEKGEVVLEFGLTPVRFFLDSDGKVKTAVRGIPGPIKRRMMAKAAAILKGKQDTAGDAPSHAKQESLGLEPADEKDA